jgi:DNA-binding transcriptional LysR family regulator
VQEPFTIDLAHLRVLRELKERGTVTATAAALHRTPSAVSQQLRTLSRSLGVALTERDGRRLRLTPQATLVLRHAESIGAQIEQVRADLAAFEAGQMGMVTIASFASAVHAIVVPAINALRQERPRLEVSIRELEAPAAFAFLDRGEIDVLVTVDYVGGPTHSDRRYHRVDLVRDPLMVVLPKNHALAAERAPLDLRALAGEPWVLGSAGHPCVDATITAHSAAGFTAAVTHRANDWSATAAIVAAGEAVALIPRLALHSIQPAGIAIREPAQATTRSIYATTRNGSERAPHIAAALAALAFAGDQCRSGAAPEPSRHNRRQRHKL